MQFIKDTWFNRPMAVVLLLAAMLPFYGPLMPTIEGGLLPVTTSIVFVDPVTRLPLLDAAGEQIVPLTADPADPTSILVRFTFTKLRACEYLGTNAQIKGITVDFESASAPSGTRLPGQITSPVWRLHATSLKDLEVRFIHRCNPFWLTVTKAYP